MTNEQKTWLLKIEREILEAFPGDPFDDDEQSSRLITMVDELYEKAHHNETVRRWLMTILGFYQDRWNILHDGRMTAREELKKIYNERREAKPS